MASYACLKLIIKQVACGAMRIIYPPRVFITGTIYIIEKNTISNSFYLFRNFGGENDWRIELDRSKADMLFYFFKLCLSYANVTKSINIEGLDIQINKIEDAIIVETRLTHAITKSHITSDDLERSISEYIIMTGVKNGLRSS